MTIEISYSKDFVPTMSIEYLDPRGVRVVFTGSNGLDSDKDYAQKMGLVVGEVYTVESLTIHGWHTDVFLQETMHIKNGLNQPVRFNSVLFLEEDQYKAFMSR